MFVPVLDTTKKLLDDNGYLTSSWSLLFTQLFNQMQVNISDDGMVVPSLTTDQITHNTDPTNPNTLPNGTIFYDTDDNKLKVKENGVIKTITTS